MAAGADSEPASYLPQRISRRLPASTTVPGPCQESRALATPRAACSEEGLLSGESRRLATMTTRLPMPTAASTVSPRLPSDMATNHPTDRPLDPLGVARTLAPSGG